MSTATNNKINQNRAYTFWVAAFALMANFIASATPIPLMTTFARILHMTSSEIAQGIFSYYMGCIVVLVFFSRLSNLLGRKAVSVISLSCGILASLLYVNPTSLITFFVARFFQGLACGFASSAIMSWVVDTAPEKKLWLGTALTAMGPNIGLSLGTLATGLSIYFEALTPDSLFIVMSCLLGVALVLIIFGGETIPKGLTTIKEALSIKIALPSRLRLIFLATASAYIGGWGLGSFFQGFSAQLSESAFGYGNSALAAFTYLACIVPNFITGIWVGRYSPAPTLRVVLTIFALATILMFWATLSTSGVWFFVFVAITGASTGAACSAGLKLILKGTTLKERAGVISAVYLAAYVGSGIPNLVVGLSKNATLFNLAFGYSIWALVAAAIVISTVTWLIKRGIVAK